jgi:hypothetical protein
VLSNISFGLCNSLPEFKRILKKIVLRSLRLVSPTVTGRVRFEKTLRTCSLDSKCKGHPRTDFEDPRGRGAEVPLYSSFSFGARWRWIPMRLMLDLRWAAFP